MKIFQTTLKMSELTGYPFLGYGHLDTFLGKNSHVDIYPKLLEWLEKYADSRNTAGGSGRNMGSDHGSDGPNMNHGQTTSSYCIVCCFLMPLFALSFVPLYTSLILSLLIRIYCCTFVFHFIHFISFKKF